MLRAFRLVGWFQLVTRLHSDGDMRAFEDSPDRRNPPAGGHGTVVAALRPSPPPRSPSGAAVGPRAESDESRGRSSLAHGRDRDGTGQGGPWQLGSRNCPLPTCQYHPLYFKTAAKHVPLCPEST